MKLRKLENEMPAVTLDFYNSKQLDPRITFTRASFAPAADPGSGTGTAGGKYNMFNVNVPRLTDNGLLIEESRTNVELNSATLGDWTRVALTEATNNQVAPDGTTTASTFTVTATNTSHHLTRTWQNGGGNAPHQAPSYSFFIKPGTQKKIAFIDNGGGRQRRVAVDFDSGTITSVFNGTNIFLAASYEPVGSGWYRVKVALSSSAWQTHTIYILPYDTLPTDFEDDVILPITDFDFAGSGETFALWGVQTELPRTSTPFVTSYIPTTTAAVTRAADLCEITGDNFSSWYRQNEWTVTNSFNVFGSSVGQLHATSFFGVGGETVLTSSVLNTTMQHFFLGGPGGTSIIDYVNLPPSTFNTDSKSALTFVQQSTAQGATNGVLASSLTRTPSTNQNIAQLSFGQRYKGTTSTTGYIQRFSFYPTSVPDSALQGATQRGGIRKL